MTLQTKLRTLYEPFLELDCEVYHYTRGSDTDVPYMVWAEDGEQDSFETDNRKQEQQLSGLVDFFTLDEFDEICDDIQEILNSEWIGWRLESVQYEEETNLIHYQWRWWTVG